jgi:hypothetical protein
MAFNILFFSMVLVKLATSTPMPVENYATGSLRMQALFNLTTTIDRQVVAAWACRDQSCIAADYAGSSGNVARAKPLGGGAADLACVKKYNPSVAANLPDGPAQSTGVSTMLMSGINALSQFSPFGATEKASPFP